MHVLTPRAMVCNIKKEEKEHRQNESLAGEEKNKPDKSPPPQASCARASRRRAAHVSSPDASTPLCSLDAAGRAGLEPLWDNPWGLYT